MFQRQSTNWYFIQFSATVCRVKTQTACQRQWPVLRNLWRSELIRQRCGSSAVVGKIAYCKYTVIWHVRVPIMKDSLNLGQWLNYFWIKTLKSISIHLHVILNSAICKTQRVDIFYQNGWQFGRQLGKTTAWGTTVCPQISSILVICHVHVAIFTTSIQSLCT